MNFLTFLKTAGGKVGKWESGRLAPELPRARAFSLSHFLTFSLAVFALWLSTPRTSAAEGAPTCKTTVTPTNNWVAAREGMRLYSVTANNTSVASLYLFIVNTNNTAANGSLPALPAIQIPSGYTGGYDFQNIGFTFSSGMVVCTSSTPDTLTVSSASFVVSVNYLGR